MFRKDLEAMTTDDLLVLRVVLQDVIKARLESEAAENGQTLLTLPYQRGSGFIDLIKSVREALGLGLREAKDLIESRATVSVPNTDAGNRLRKLVEKLQGLRDG